MHLAYRWFTGLDFDQEIPHHSTFSKNRHEDEREFLHLFADPCVSILCTWLEPAAVHSLPSTVPNTYFCLSASGMTPLRLAQGFAVTTVLLLSLATVNQLSVSHSPSQPNCGTNRVARVSQR